MEIGDNCLAGSVEFRAIIAIAGSGEGAQPLLGMGMENGSAGAYNLTPFASEIAWRADLGHAAAWLQGNSGAVTRAR